jgi:hypothetical protein
MINLQEIKKEIKKIKEEYIKLIGNLKKRTKKFEGLIAKIPRGEYKNRFGKITSCIIDTDGEILVLIRPFRLRGKGDPLLWDKYDARTFWKLSEVEEINQGVF